MKISTEAKNTTNSRSPEIPRDLSLAIDENNLVVFVHTMTRKTLVNAN